jgi:hypothetical protein
VVDAGLKRLRSMFGEKNVSKLLNAASDDLSGFLRAMADSGFNQSDGFEFFMALTSRPDALAFGRKYGAKVLGKLWRRYGSGDAFAAAMAKTDALVNAATTAEAKQAVLDGLVDAKKPALDKTLGLAEPKPVAPPKPTKKNLGINRTSAEWKRLRADVEAQSIKNGHGFTSDQLDVWADMRQTIAAARRDGFSALGHKAKLDLLDAFDKRAKAAKLPQTHINGLRGDLSEWLFSPGRGSAKTVFKDGSPVSWGTKDATIPDYSIDVPGGGKEWINQKSDLIDRSLADARTAARTYRRVGYTEARNVPPGDKYSLDFVRDPGEAARITMLEIIFEPPSPVYRVKIGEIWYTGVPKKAP